MPGTAAATAQPAAGSFTAASRGTSRRWDAPFFGLLALAAISTLATIQIIAFRAPVEASMGIVQKIFYFHVPSAYAMYVGAAACFVGSAGYLYNGKRAWDSLAKAGAEVAVAMGLMVMI